MADKQTSQSQKKKSFDPSATMEGFMTELERLETRGMEQAQLALDAWSTLARAQLDYATRMSAEWRKMTLDASRRAGAAFTAR